MAKQTTEEWPQRVGKLFSDLEGFGHFWSLRTLDLEDKGECFGLVIDARLKETKPYRSKVTGKVRTVRKLERIFEATGEDLPLLLETGIEACEDFEKGVNLYVRSSRKSRSR